MQWVQQRLCYIYIDNALHLLLNQDSDNNAVTLTRWQIHSRGIYSRCYDAAEISCTTNRFHYTLLEIHDPASTHTYIHGIFTAPWSEDDKNNQRPNIQGDLVERCREGMNAMVLCREDCIVQVNYKNWVRRFLTRPAQLGYTVSFTLNVLENIYTAKKEINTATGSTKNIN